MTQSATFESRAARSGDICVLLLHARDETPAVRDWQNSLQRVFGGQVVSDVHLTCQRLEASDGLLPVLVQRLQDATRVLHPFALTAVQAVPFYSRFRQTHILKVGVATSDELTMFELMLAEAMISCSLASLYRAGARSTLVTALEDIHEVDGVSREVELLFPRPLFCARQIVFSRIKGVGDYEVIETIPLS